VADGEGVFKGRGGRLKEGRGEYWRVFSVCAGGDFGGFFGKFFRKIFKIFTIFVKFLRFS
jgi:hypothetical protein